MGRVLVADRGDHRLAALLRHRPRLRIRQRRTDARDLARRISLLGGIAGAASSTRSGCAARATASSRSRIPWRPRSPSASRWGASKISIIADHLGKPTSWLLAWQYRGGTIAPPFRCVAERCAADLQGDRLQIITRAGAELRGTAGLIASGVGVHQTALYDMLLAGGLFLFLWFVMMRRPRREGS